MNYNNFMKLTLKNKKSAAAAMEVLRTRLDAGFDCDHTYRRNPSQLMRGDLELSGKTVVLCEDSGCYIPEDAIDVQIALMEDLANALSGEAFSCDFYKNLCSCLIFFFTCRKSTIFVQIIGKLLFIICSCL